MKWNENEPPDGSKGRALYVPPAIEESADFETLALACGKLDDQDLACLAMGGAAAS